MAFTVSSLQADNMQNSGKHTRKDANAQKNQSRLCRKRDLTGRRCEVGEEEGSVTKFTWNHALAIRAAAEAAVVPEQNPPAAQLWGATPESPYWSRGWAETHFLWAQVTWHKEQTKGFEADGQEVMETGRGLKMEGGGGEGCRWGEGSEVNLVKERVEKATRKRGGVNKKKETKNYRRHLPSRSRLVKTNYVNKGVKGSKTLSEAQINTLIKSCRRKKKQPWLSH